MLWFLTAVNPRPNSCWGAPIVALTTAVGRSWTTQALWSSTSRKASSALSLGTWQDYILIFYSAMSSEDFTLIFYSAWRSETCQDFTYIFYSALSSETWQDFTHIFYSALSSKTRQDFTHTLYSALSSETSQDFTLIFLEQIESNWCIKERNR